MILLPGYAQTLSHAGDPSAVATVFRKCMGCHQVGPDAKAGVGPHLNGIVGRPAASIPGYSYSATLRSASLVWNEPTLSDFLRSPSKRVPGTYMTFAGISGDQDIADVIAYLKAMSSKLD
ncbi:MAG: cytochrome c family protein [Burkholderiales bacterium]|nr:MAG: cytochrome c family protein [Burkholderiales bacterium]